MSKIGERNYIFLSIFGLILPLKMILGKRFHYRFIRPSPDFFQIYFWCSPLKRILIAIVTEFFGVI